MPASSTPLSSPQPPSRREALALLGLSELPASRQALHGAIQRTNPGLDGWGDRELEAYRRLWRFLPPEDACQPQGLRAA
jgi:hypothetical protein